ncbi:hypothetical protein [Fodinicola feengrottensis]
MGTRGDRATRPGRWVAAVCAVPLLALAACAGPAPVPQPTTSATPQLPPRQQLAARAAQATALKFTATYALTGGNAQQAASSSAPASQSVTISRTADGWRLDIGDSAQVISLVHTTAGTWKCTLSGAAPSCAQVAAAGQPPPADDDFALLKVFTAWPQELANPATAIAVNVTSSPPAPTGVCFEVDIVSASIAAPVDPGTYCYDANGVLTGLRTSTGTLKLVSSGAPPAALALPAPLVAAGAPVSPTPTPSSSPSGR